MKDDDRARPAEPGMGENEEIEALATILPRALIAEGLALPLARDWIGRRRRALVEGHPGFARYKISVVVADGLFHARRARRLVRGLEGAAAALEAEEAGLKKTQAKSGAGGETSRISRLLVLSQDGAPRFFREVEKIEARFARRLAVLVLECDEVVLGEAAFGPGKKARALLIDHKDAVIRFLLLLDWSREDGAVEVSD